MTLTDSENDLGLLLNYSLCDLVNSVKLINLTFHIMDRKET